MLEEVRTVRDICAQECARTENQLYAAQQAVSALTIQLRIANEKLNTIDDVVGEVRNRMQRRGLATHPITQRPSPNIVLSVGLSNETPPREFQ